MLKRFVRLSIASLLFIVSLHIGLQDVIDSSSIDSVVELKNATLSLVTP